MNVFEEFDCRKIVEKMVLTHCSVVRFILKGFIGVLIHFTQQHCGTHHFKLLKYYISIEEHMGIPHLHLDTQ